MTGISFVRSVVMNRVLILVLVLVFVQYFFASIFVSSGFRIHPYAPVSNDLDFRDPKNKIIEMNAEKGLETPQIITDIMNSSENMATIDSNETDMNTTNEVSQGHLPLCDMTPPDLGPITVNVTELKLEWLKKKFPEMQWGGHYIPPDCTARHKLAIIVPYRNRQEQLPIFLAHMHKFLIKQQIEYCIYVIEQDGISKFNRAKLLNVGFVESQKLQPGGWQCFIFHDVDLLPLDTRNTYCCSRQPRHMLPYRTLFGGVIAMTLEQFKSVNGFSNSYWGWGAEDDDMYIRLHSKGYFIARYRNSVARYIMLNHNKTWRRTNMPKTTDFSNGLSTLNYDKIYVTQYQLYTHILVNINKKS